MADSSSGGSGGSRQARGIIGHHLGGCLITEKIGQGGMGAVFKGHHEGLDLDVAVKVMPPSFAKASKKNIERFFREARSAARIKHPNIVGVHNVGNEHGVYFIVMELIEGLSLQQRLKAEGFIPEEEAFEIMQQALGAMEYARQNGIVHRDLKPDNIMIDGAGVVKVMDLGLAKSVEEQDLGMTQAGATMGTPNYMSPEQAEDAAGVDHRSDLYSLGCTLYHMICGDVPFKGPSMYAVMRMHNTEPVPDPREKNSMISDSLADYIMKLMAKSPEDRYQTAGEAIEDLRKIQAGKSVVIETPPVPEPSRPAPSRAEAVQPEEKPVSRPRRAEAPAKKSPMPFILGGVGALVLVVILVVALMPKSGDPAPTSPGATPSTTKVDPTPLPPKKAPVVAIRPDAAPAKILPKPVETPVKKPVEKLVAKPTPKPVAKPASTDPVQALHDALLMRNPKYTGRATISLENGKIVDVNLKKCGVVRLDPLKGLPLRNLDLSENGIKDLSPLRGMSLKWLSLKKCRGITTLEPLKGMPLVDLILTDCPGVSNLSPLAGMPLKTLYMENCPRVTDLSPLKKSPLDVLRIDGCEGVGSLAALTMPSLTVLSLTDCPKIGDVTPLHALKLKRLSFTPKYVRKGLKGLRAMKSIKEIGVAVDDRRMWPPENFWSYYDSGRLGTPLYDDLHAALKQANPKYTKNAKFVIREGEIVQVALVNCNVADLSPLKEYPLTWLRIEACPVKDLSPIQGKLIETLNLAGCTELVNLAPLKGMPVTSLNLKGCTKVADLSPLKGMKLTSLTLSGCAAVKKIDALAGMPIQQLFMDGCAGVADLSPLKKVPLSTFNIIGCPKITDVTPIAKAPLAQLCFEPKTVKKGYDELRKVKSLRGLGNNSRRLDTADIFWLKFDAGRFK